VNALGEKALASGPWHSMHPELCVLCHDELADVLKGPHEPAGFAPAVRQALALHPSTGACRVCHTTHNAQGPHLWARTPADSAAGPVSNLCGACHGEGPVKEPQETHHPLSIANSGLKRAADANPKSEMRNPKSDEVGCASCHDPHGGPDSTALLRHPADGLCAECHEDKQGVKGSRHDPGASEWGKKLGFTSKGLCVDCHPIHGPKEDGGIWASFPDEMVRGQPCEACHRAGAPGPAVAAPHMGKPLDFGLKRAGDADPQSAIRNPQSVVLCTTCHDIHQKEPAPMLLRSPRQDSGLCLTCHSEAGGLPGTLHDLRLSAPEARNVRGETAAESGPCGSCHLVHPTGGGYGTWAYGAASEGSFGSAHCTCCHAEGQCAAQRVPAYVDHPRVPLLNRIAPDDPGYMPTFDEHGAPSRTGAISCPTCHELHATASPPPNAPYRIGDSAPLEAQDGASPPYNPHLRTTAHQRLCIDCHGIEALWRFLYYHEGHRNPYPKRNMSPPTVDARNEARTE
jgi:predicted CXXCH cytochrome family protein